MNQNNNQTTKSNKKYFSTINCDYAKIFSKHHNKRINPWYHSREERNHFAAQRLKSLDASRILNLGGGGRRHLAQALGDSDIAVFEIDMDGDCDLLLNLDTIDTLPFTDHSFDVVCAFDVLEHTEKFHSLNYEMLRLSSRHILISLPNSAVEIYEKMFGNRGCAKCEPEQGVFSKFYGLPLERPQDRHRWWLYFDDIVRYYYNFANSNNLTLEFWTPKNDVKRLIFSLVFGKRLCNQIFCPSIWILMTKRSESPA